MDTGATGVGWRAWDVCVVGTRQSWSFDVGQSTGRFLAVSDKEGVGGVRI